MPPRERNALLQRQLANISATLAHASNRRDTVAKKAAGVHSRSARLLADTLKTPINQVNPEDKEGLETMHDE